MLLKGLLENGYCVNLISSRGGILDELSPHPNLNKKSYHYEFTRNPILTCFRYLAIQFYTFVLSFKYCFPLSKENIFLINTLLPIGPAIAGKLMGKDIVFYYHENASAKGLHYRILGYFMQYLATEIVCVSKFQASTIKKSSKVNIIPNAVPIEFVNKINVDANKAFSNKTVLMISSLKFYKGINEFIFIAKKLPTYNFLLVINAGTSEIERFFSEQIKPINLQIHPRQKDVSQFYNKSSLVLNLTNKNCAIETFGLTALEAMSAGLPVIVPIVGGIAELVENGVNGYKIDVQELDKIGLTIRNVLTNRKLYIQLSRNAQALARRYAESSMIKSFISLIEKKTDD